MAYWYLPWRVVSCSSSGLGASTFAAEVGAGAAVIEIMLRNSDTSQVIKLNGYGVGVSFGVGTLPVSLESASLAESQGTSWTEAEQPLWTMDRHYASEGLQPDDFLGGFQLFDAGFTVGTVKNSIFFGIFHETWLPAVASLVKHKACGWFAGGTTHLDYAEVSLANYRFQINSVT